MPILGPGGLSVLDVHPLRTVARGTDSRQTTMLTLAAVLACVINGDTMSSVLHQATWLVVAITILVVVQLVAARLPEKAVEPVTTSGADTDA
ncbi:MULTISPECIES: hypothetical protein [Streptomyces]|uniref:hypothetical protein n=1 Tax=Streptomyces TaxID=1883 RepID=UPI0007C6D257|nr:hypothetical protein [Streptomyces sp. AS58]